MERIQFLICSFSPAQNVKWGVKSVCEELLKLNKVLM